MPLGHGLPERVSLSQTPDRPCVTFTDRRRSVGAMLTNLADSQRRSRAAFDGKAERCASLLNHARRLLVLRSYGPLFNQILARTYDLFDDLDEILVGLDPAQDHEAFARVAELHRQFEDIQSVIPRSRRGVDWVRFRARRSNTRSVLLLQTEFF